MPFLKIALDTILTPFTKAIPCTTFTPDPQFALFALFLASSVHWLPVGPVAKQAITGINGDLR